MYIGLKFSCNFAFIMSTLLLYPVRLYILRSNGWFAKIARISQSLGKSDSFFGSKLLGQDFTLNCIFRVAL